LIPVTEKAEPEVNKNILLSRGACVWWIIFGAMHYLQTTFRNNEKTVSVDGRRKAKLIS